MPKYSKLHRLYLEQDINLQETIHIRDDKFNYCKSVIRLRVGDSFRVFNENSGEFFGQHY